MSELFAYAGVFAMTRENLGFVRQLTEMAQTVDDAEHAASREIGSADRVVEEGVAGEGYVLCLAIEGDGTAAVARSGDDLNSWLPNLMTSSSSKNLPIGGNW